MGQSVAQRRPDADAHPPRPLAAPPPHAAAAPLTTIGPLSLSSHCCGRGVAGSLHGAQPPAGGGRAFERTNKNRKDPTSEVTIAYISELFGLPRHATVPSRATCAASRSWPWCARRTGAPPAYCGM